MQLTKVTIDSFRTFATPQPLLIDPRATILVGANESGKTNALQALEFLSPSKELKREDISKVNRERYSQTKLPCLSFSFLPDEEEIKEIAKIFPELTEQTPIIIKRDGKSFSIIVPSERLLPKLTSIENNLNVEKEKLEKRIVTLTNEINAISAESTAISHKFGDVIPPSNKTQLDKLEKDFRNKIRERDQTLVDEKRALEEKILRNELRISLAKNDILSDTESEVSKILELIPQIIYLDNKLEAFPESISIKEVKEQATSKAKLVGNLLKLGKIFNFSDLDEGHRTLNRVLKKASATISEEFEKFWTQEDVDIEVEKQSDELSFSISGGVSVNSSPNERSEGFRWLLSFFSRFATNFESDWKNKIFLIDEPAALLYPMGQKDVLKILEKIAVSTQVVYSTHSPFLINKNFPQRIRLFTKNAEKGTMINNKPYSDGKTMFFWEPLRSSIGVNLGDALSFGEVNLIVEGISDRIIISGISKKFAELNYPFIDLEKVSIIEAMGADCEEYLARFALSQQLEAICLLDNDSKGKSARACLQKEKEIKLISINEVKEDAVTIEDLFPEDVYIRAVNSANSRFDKNFKIYKSEAEKERAKGIIARIGKHFEKNGYSELNKVAVASELIQNLDVSPENISQYEPFKKLIIMIDEMQQKAPSR